MLLRLSLLPASRASGMGLPQAPATASASVPRGVLLSPGPVYSRTPLVPRPQPRTLTLASNSTWMVPALAHCLNRSAALLAARAYVHWYERFGVTAEHLLVAMESVQAAIDAYRTVRRLPGPG